MRSRRCACSPHVCRASFIASCVGQYQIRLRSSSSTQSQSDAKIRFGKCKTLKFIVLRCCASCACRHARIAPSGGCARICQNLLIGSAFVCKRMQARSLQAQCRARWTLFSEVHPALACKYAGLPTFRKCVLQGKTLNVQKLVTSASFRGL